MTVDGIPVVVDRSTTSRGELVLRRRGAEPQAVWEIISNGVFLMDTAGGASERTLVRAALDAVPGAALRVAVCGLGMGFSLREALAEPRVARVTVVEIEPALVAWHRGPLAPVSGGALDDVRVDVWVGDVGEWLAAAGPSYDAICLDVDNGPHWTVTAENRSLYDNPATAAVRRRLGTPGAFSVWSAAAVPAYERLLVRWFDTVTVHEVPVPRGEPDVVYVATR